MKPVFSINNDEEEEDPLQKQFKTLELEWDSIKQSISRSNRRSSTTVAGDNNIIHPYADSPKKLMALLQNEYSPNSGIIEQPEVDFDDGVLRGRRLFEESEVDSNVDNRLHGECFDLGEKSEVSTEYVFKGFEEYDEKYNCTDSPACDTAESGVVMVAVKGGSGGSVGRWFVSLVVMLFALVIVALECSGEDKSILVPT